MLSHGTSDQDKVEVHFMG